MSCGLPSKPVVSDAAQHQVCHGNSEMSLTTLSQRLVVFTVPAVPADPSECSFHNPTPWQDFKSHSLCGAADDLQDPSTALLRPFHDMSVDRIGPNQLQSRSFSANLLQDTLGSVVVLDRCRMHDQSDDQSQRVDQDEETGSGLFVCHKATNTRDSANGSHLF